MDLKDFIKETVLAYANSVSELREELEGRGFFVEPTSQVNSVTENVRVDQNDYSELKKIKFDIAVSVSDSDGKDIKAGINVFNVGIGAGKSSIAETSNVSRIQFDIKVSSPKSNQSFSHK